MLIYFLSLKKQNHFRPKQKEKITIINFQRPRLCVKETLKFSLNHHYYNDILFNIKVHLYYITLLICYLLFSCFFTYRIFSQHTTKKHEKQT